MNNNIAIKVENLSKCYSLRTPIKDADGNLTTEHWALKDVSFEIKKGESVGIIGPNGSGKSTLLKILAGITKPTSGKVTINGRVASILDVGAGFHPELSGRENVFLNGQIHGFTKKEIATKFDQIAEFSGVKKFIDEPVKNYSDGMFLRLAFSIIIHLDFDVYLFDEVLSVGDVEFRKKSYYAIYELGQKSNKTFLTVSHHMYEINSFCPRIFSFEGKKLLSYKNLESTMVFKSNSNIPNFVKKINLETRNTEGELSNDFFNTDSITIVIQNEFIENKNIELGIKLSGSDGDVVFSTSPIIGRNGINSIDFFEHQSFKCFIPSFLLNVGEYNISVVYFNKDKLLGVIDNTCKFIIRINPNFYSHRFLGEKGLVKPYIEWEIK